MERQPGPPTTTAGAGRMAELISDLLDYTTARDAEMTTTGTRSA